MQEGLHPRRDPTCDESQTKCRNSYGRESHVGGTGVGRVRRGGSHGVDVLCKRFGTTELSTTTSGERPRRHDCHCSNSDAHRAYTEQRASHTHTVPSHTPPVPRRIHTHHTMPHTRLISDPSQAIERTRSPQVWPVSFAWFIFTLTHESLGGGLSCLCDGCALWMAS